MSHVAAVGQDGGNGGPGGLAGEKLLAPDFVVANRPLSPDDVDVELVGILQSRIDAVLPMAPLANLQSSTVVGS